jgi:ADP-dependent NAD(P)H-hydrate dehydratase / NAD(P)H-hydrate epimerase
MRPVVTPEEMAAIDAAAPEPVDVLIGRAGAATARVALDMLGGTYARRVVVVAGKGNNGNDGRDAAARLARRGARVTEIPASEAPAQLPASDLVIDAAYGTGFRGEYHAPDPGGAPVLAVDIPSGVNGLTGEASGTPMVAARTVTFAALKPGLLFHPGRHVAGGVTLADIGLDVSSARTGVVDAADALAWLPPRPATAHKWRAALLVVAGSPGMMGAAHLVCAAAQRSGVGMVRAVPARPDASRLPSMSQLPIEAVGVDPGTDRDWDEAAAGEVGTGRIHAMVIGPGLGRAENTVAAVRRLLGSMATGSTAAVGLLVDGDGLTALGSAAADLLGERRTPAVLTPHDGEYARLMDEQPGPDRCEAARRLAERVRAVVLLKGPTTTIAHPDGRVRLVTAGDQRLATAGTGDVLSGVIGALLARRLDPFDAAAAGAWLHGMASQRGPAEGLVASDIVAALPATLAAVRSRGSS